MRKHHGLSLAEVLFVCMLLGLGLLLVAGLFREYTRILSNARAQDIKTEAISHLSGLLRRDAQGAYQILEPSPSGQSSRLRVIKFRPQATRFDSVTSFQRYNAADSQEVHYELQGKSLYRDIPNLNREELLAKVESFQCKRSPNLLTVFVEFDNGRTKEALSLTTYLAVKGPSP